MSILFTRVPNVGASRAADLVVALQVIGTVQKADFEVLGPRLDLLVEQHGKLNLIVELVDFEGWTAGGAWEDVKLALKHFNDIERIAIVGEGRWAQGSSVLVRPFTAAEVRYFDLADKASADEWIREETTT